MMLFALVLIVGCSSGSGQMSEGKKAVEGFGDTKVALQKAQAQVDKTLSTMNAMSAGGDLKKSYAAFNDSVADLEKTASAARKRSAGMQANVDAYVKKWQAEMEKMNDPTIKASLAERRDAVKSNFETVRNDATAARDAYQPFITQVKEIQKALSINLTPSMVPGLKPGMDKANALGATLKQKLGAMQADLDKITAGLSASGAAPKK
jgi:hypothetical protein